MTNQEDHCWHVEELAIVKMVNPSNWPVICCNCGLQAHAKMKREVVPGHGPFAQMDQLVYPKPNTCFTR